MSERFLSDCGWDSSNRAPVAGDASGRRFTRLTGPRGSAILMESPGTDIEPFVRAAAHFSALGLSCPGIFAEDREAGLVLMEDLGDALFSVEIAADPALELPLYEAATDLLVALHAHAPPDWAERYDPSRMAAFLEPFEAAYGSSNIPARLNELLTRHAPETDILLHRDYHAQNLLWLPDRTGVAQVGLVDFQDALAGHRAYDLASLLQDARRDVAPALEEQMIARYLAATGLDPERFRAAYALQSAQRHLRILGIFRRLAAQQGKTQYLALVPRVRSYLERCLSHPVAAPLVEELTKIMPQPEGTA
ncbi:aminoglycoside phosphotransferase family protein [Palleronia caenipelagi]|uniref:Aminoglycoside phosphotransferase n=1 Tax=Palleronia caenipelagi TaxID=2489174 RepID=A0A547Q6N3_9RHOB|nr:phosphotransferase [Palleronia caenipelagi]TRD22047.1 aminoglycoside phosphotransferase [Palleronia caenipelagi]